MTSKVAEEKDQTVKSEKQAKPLSCALPPEASTFTCLRILYSLKLSEIVASGIDDSVPGSLSSTKRQLPSSPARGGSSLSRNSMSSLSSSSSSSSSATAWTAAMTSPWHFGFSVWYELTIPDLDSLIPDAGSGIPDVGSRIPNLGYPVGRLLHYPLTESWRRSTGEGFIQEESMKNQGRAIAEEEL